MRRLLFLTFTLLVALPGFCKDKKKQRLPDAVLDARTVAVYVMPDVGETLSGDQQKARATVEHALREWGRYRVQTFGVETPNLDLIIEVKKGGGVRKTIAGLPQRGTTIDRSSAGIDVSVGSLGGPRPTPHTQTEAASPDDEFYVYMQMGDAKALVYRFSAKNALDAPTVRAVYEFKKAVEESENVRRQNSPTP
jgi:hypothetical protein